MQKYSFAHPLRNKKQNSRILDPVLLFFQTPAKLYNQADDNKFHFSWQEKK